MSKALVSFGTGAAAELFRIAEPGFRTYADRHGYEFLKPAHVPSERPASWYKIATILPALRTYDTVLWIDADVLILDGSQDLADEVPAHVWQAMVKHHTSDGEVPNHGVWLVRRTMIPILQRIWSMTQYLQHPWWEQAAGCELLGYDPLERPMRRKVNTPLFEFTHWLGLEWNSHVNDEHPRPRFWHASCRGDRAHLMRHKLNERITA